MFDSEAILNDIGILVRRINNDIDGYYRVYYIYPERSIFKDMYNNLYKAFTSCGRLVENNLVIDTPFDDFASEDEDEILMICIKNIVQTVFDNYNIEVAKDTIGILNRIQEHSKSYLTHIQFETLSKIIRKISFFYYLKSHKEYQKVEELFDIYDLIDEEYDDIRLLLGNKILLEEFYKKLSVIPTIEDKYFRSTICEHFRCKIRKDCVDFL